MKYFIHTIFSVFLSTYLYAQKITPQQIISHSEKQMIVYQPQIQSGQHLYLKMNYGSSFIQNPTEIKKIKGGQVVAVDVVCTDDPQGENLSELNKNRLKQLYKLIPNLFNNTTIQWDVIRQTQCVDKISAQELFHGIVITYRPQSTKTTIDKEITYIDKSLDSIFLTKALEISDEEYIIETNFLSDSLVFDSSRFPKTGYRTIDYSTTFRLLDSTVINVLNENKEQWKDAMIVADVTGSMSPYILQLFIWLKLNTIDIKKKHFVFFNDGNMTPDYKKVIGKTGGIYSTHTSSFKQVKRVAYKTMRRGYGGDTPENDIEALLKAIKICESCNEIVLIADNWAPIKDISLLKKVKKPVHVILCGADLGVNTQYLQLAKETGGTIHTMEESLDNLMTLKEGEKLKFQEKKYRIKKGKFILY